MSRTGHVKKERSGRYVSGNGAVSGSPTNWRSGDLTVFLRYLLFSKASSHCWNWGSVAEERRWGRCGNGDRVGGDRDGIIGNGNGLNGDEIHPHAHLYPHSPLKRYQNFDGGCFQVINALS
jgi:hypothetical protein